MSSSAGMAQIQIGTVTGTVVDPSGAPVASATITLQNFVSGFRRTTSTDPQATFVFHNVPFGRYVLRAEFFGFQRFEESIQVGSNLPVVLNLELKLPGNSEVVVVEGCWNEIARAQKPESTKASFKDFRGPGPVPGCSRLLPRCLAGARKTMGCCMPEAWMTDSFLSWMEFL